MKNIFKYIGMAIFMAVLFLVASGLAENLAQNIGLTIFAGTGTLAAILPVNLDIAPGECKLAGLGTSVYWVDKNDIDTFPGFLSTTAPGDQVKLDGNITLLAGKYWTEIQTPTKINQLNGNSGGEAGMRYFNFVGSFTHPSTEAWALEQAKLLNNSQVIILMKDLATGNMVCLGSPDLPVEPQADIKWGQKPGDPVGVEFKFEYANCTPVIYDGTYTVRPDTVS